MSQADLKTIFSNRIKEFSQKYEVLNSKHKSLSLIRIVVFVSLTGLIVYAANIKNPYFLVSTTLIFGITFIFLIQKHNLIKFKRYNALFSKQINEEEMLRAEGKLSSLYDGMKYSSKDHFYAPDLDVFGSNSLFQLTVRSRLDRTRDLAANWLLNHANRQEILQRQEAIKELNNDIDWRQEFTALGMHSEESDENKKTKQGDFDSWLLGNDQFLESNLWKFVTPLMSMASITTFSLIWFFDFPYQIIYIPVLINAVLIKVVFAPLSILTKTFETTIASLKSYENLIVQIEGRKFSSEKLVKLKSILESSDHKASNAIRKLRTVLFQLLNRANWMYVLLNIFFLFDVALLVKAEKWKKRFGSKLINWFDAVHEIDLLNDMASLAYANPDFVFPILNDKNYQLESKELGHPLIQQSERIKNDFALCDQGKLGLITGSNMSGKSTFLRAVGINLVMAQSGLPVCASSYSVSPTRVFTSMRTQDNLEEHISSFYAELSRIKLLLDSINEEPVFYLLDEILKGTNSEDRHKGSISLIDQLSHKNATGLISTHDLTLSNLESKQVKNYSFNSEIKGDEIIFDYKLTDGPCRSFNASKLMQKMGIIV